MKFFHRTGQNALLKILTGSKVIPLKKIVSWFKKQTHLFHGEPK